MSIADQITKAWNNANATVDQYALKAKKAPKSSDLQSSLFETEHQPKLPGHGNANWDETAHPRVAKGSQQAHGGQFTSKESIDSLPGGKADGKPDSVFKPTLLEQGKKVESEHTDKPAIAKEIAKDHLSEDPNYYDKLKKMEQGPIPLRERKAFAEAMAKQGKTSAEIAGAMVKRGVAISDASRLANGATGNKSDRPALEVPKPAENSAAKSGDQMGLFGEVANVKSDETPKLDVAGETKGIPQGLFDKKGDPDQIMMFDDGVTPEDRLLKTEANAEGPKDGDINSEGLIFRNGRWHRENEKAIADGKKKLANKHGIEDFGEKIGGARKDIAVPIGPRVKVEQPKDDRPAWKRRYEVGEDANRPGEFFVVDKVTQQPFGPGDMPNNNSFSSMLAKRLAKQGKKLSDFKNFDSKEAAEAALEQIAVNRNHDVRNIAKRGEPDNYAIYRKVSDKKRPAIKAGFTTREEAESYMQKNPGEIAGHEFPDWEDYSYLDRVTRIGKEHREGDKDVKPKDFQESFNFRGGEFGKWQINRDGQTSLNHAYDALHDLADTIGLPPRAMSLDGKLAIAFGARGTGGKHSAKAHYEPDKEVINLTKMKGAGSLAHEWFHALDHYMAQQVHGSDKGEKTSRLLTESLPYGKGHKGRQEVVDAWKHLVDTMNSREVDEKIVGDDKRLSHAKKTVADQVDKLDTMIESNKQYNKRHKGLTADERKEWDSLKDKIKSLDVGDKTYIAAITGDDQKPYSGRGFTSPQTFKPLQRLNELYKKATGRSFHTADDNSQGHSIYWSIWRAQHEAEKLAKANEGATATMKRSSQFLDDASALDSYRSGDYYATNEEMAARAFQAYIYDKTEAVDKPSQYLNGKAHNKHYAHLLTEDGDPYRPFPEGAEREKLNKAFDGLFSAIKHESRSDDKGEHVKLYAARSRSFQPMLVDRYSEKSSSVGRFSPVLLH